MALKIALINMPFASLDRPSIALAQLRGIAQQRFGSQVEVQVHHVGHEFGRLIGPKAYQIIAHSNASAAGEWLFRDVAFPDQPDNTKDYLNRYGPRASASGRKFFEERIVPLRPRLVPILDELIERRRLFEADIVGLTSMFWQNLACIALARRLRLVNPRQTIVLGGANCEGTMGIELISHVDVIDFVFSGHGLVSFTQMLEHLLRGETEACHQIDGVLSRRNCVSIDALGELPADFDWSKHKPESQVRGIRPVGLELDLNVPVETDFDDYLKSLIEYIPEVLPEAVIPFETSRGCWWGERAHCTFCGLNGSTMAYRAMQPALATALMQRLIDKYSAQVSKFESVDNILAREYLTEVFPKLRVPAHVTLFYEVKADLTEEQLKVLAAANVREVQPGIEALATSTLKLMRKGTTAFNNLTLLANCAKYGIKPVWNLLIGFPGESEEIYEFYHGILPHLFHLPPPGGVYLVRFDRFSPYFMLEKQYGLRLVPYDYYRLCYPFATNALRNMAYYFQDAAPDAQYIRGAARWMPKLGAQVAEWQARWARAEARPRLELHGTAEQASIEDTRARVLNRYLLPEPAADLIRQIEKVQREDALQPVHLALLDGLRQKGLTFSERGRVMSLVSLPS